MHDCDVNPVDIDGAYITEYFLTLPMHFKLSFNTFVRIELEFEYFLEAKKS